MRVLITDGDNEIAEVVREALRLSGYAVDRVATGNLADTALRAKSFDLLILDLDVEGISGAQVLSRLRCRESKLPVLALSVVDTIERRVDALDRGADAFMAKPFSIPELLARVRALIRRGARCPAEEVTVGNLSFDLIGRTATVRRQILDLTSREIEVLEIFATRAGRVVTKDQLASELSRHGEDVTTNAIEVYVHRLRRKLKTSGAAITTEKGLGYCLQHGRPTPFSPRAT
ncbi:response regulator transcription factor [Cupriavidus taiwanensis]|uniref:DNA-binding response regulator n=1 Tax=Cupriavidus pauculus TaxID=82633 RepID=A0A3G8H2K4_9BURK|nr:MULTISPECIES: response regulator transcription factor [Cupriavidus]AZG14505.1 DNA-binding response regulator [Cupriavidus pauculus]MBY4732198.1 response regulator transcription factor [Cupriavidus pauculus]MDK3024207.1 response regulator transcription factor [Cupriavidus taiwanensis]